MSVVVEIEIDDDQAERFFDYAGYKVRREMSRPLGFIAQHIRDLLFEQFSTEGAVFPTPGESRWAPLAESTVERKGSSRILVDTGDLLEETMTSVHQHGDSVVVDVNRYTKDGYWLPEIHNKGRGVPGIAGYMPARPIWETTDEFEGFVELTFWEWLQELKSANVRRRNLPGGLGGVSVIPTFSAF